MAGKLRWRVSGLFILFLFSTGFSQQYRFPYRDSLATEIKFWKRVFTEYSSNQVLMHDSRYPSVIYRVVTFDSTVSPRKREREIRYQKKIISALLRKLNDSETSGQALTAWEKSVKNQFNAIREPQKYLNAARRIRSQQGIRENFMAGVERSYRYLPYLRDIFREYGLPQELIYIPHLESSFNPQARSHAGAVGMWQFMRQTARLFMRVNRVVDERYDPLKASRAAARFLRANYRKTSDWALAITAYNYGLYGIKRAVRRLGPDYLRIRENYLSRRFGFASKSFYPEFLAVVEIMDSLSVYGPGLRPDAVWSFNEFKLPQRTNLKSLAKKTGLQVAELRRLNPAFTSRVWRGWRSVPAGYEIRLPVRLSPEMVEAAFLNGSQSVAYRKPRKLSGQKTAGTLPALAINLTEFPGRRTVEYAETSEKMAEVLSRQAAWLSPLNFLKAGSVTGAVPLENTGFSNIPGPQGQNNEIARQIQEKVVVQGNKITVYPNETLGHYAQWLNIPTQRIRDLNYLTRRSKIYTGQTLKLDFSVVSPEIFTRKRVRFHLDRVASLVNADRKMRLVAYRVSRGENLWEIAAKNSTLPLEMIFYFNQMNTLSRLKPGDVIAVPVLYN